MKRLSVVALVIGWGGCSLIVIGHGLDAEARSRKKAAGATSCGVERWSRFGEHWSIEAAASWHFHGKPEARFGVRGSW